MEKNDSDPDKKLINEIKSDAIKKIRSKKEGADILFGLGAFGIIGWSVAVPVLIGVSAGLYLDKKFTQGFSWTLTLLFTGVITGCINAWLWVKKKSSNE